MLSEINQEIQNLCNSFKEINNQDKLTSGELENLRKLAQDYKKLNTQIISDTLECLEREIRSYLKRKDTKKGGKIYVYKLYCNILNKSGISNRKLQNDYNYLINNKSSKKNIIKKTIEDPEIIPIKKTKSESKINTINTSEQIILNPPFDIKQNNNQEILKIFNNPEICNLLNSELKSRIDKDKIINYHGWENVKILKINKQFTTAPSHLDIYNQTGKESVKSYQMMIEVDIYKQKCIFPIEFKFIEQNGNISKVDHAIDNMETITIPPQIDVFGSEKNKLEALKYYISEIGVNSEIEHLKLVTDSEYCQIQKTGKHNQQEQYIINSFPYKYQYRTGFIKLTLLNDGTIHQKENFTYLS